MVASPDYRNVFMINQNSCKGSITHHRSVWEDLDQLLKRYFTDLQTRALRIINNGIPVRRCILLPFVISSEPTIHPRMIVSIKNRFEGGNEDQWNKKDDTHNPAIQSCIVLVAQAHQR